MIVAGTVAALVLLGLLWSQRLAETTYVITDAGRVVVHTTSARDPDMILEEAGLALQPGDYYVIRQDAGETVMEVCREQQITVRYHGQIMETSSRGEAVWQLLERLNVDWTEGDVISMPLDAGTYDGMVLNVDQVLRQEQDYTAVLHHQTIRCGDPTLPVGEEQILIPGRNGEMICTAEVTYVNGVETDRTVVCRRVTVQPVDAVVAVGTGQQVPEEKENTMPVVGNGLIRLPTGEVLTYSEVITSLATAYCDKGKTATGTQARVGAIAVDPDYIPYGTRMFIMTMDGEYIYGIATAEDCGSKEFIHDTRIDLHFDTYAECRQFGARWCWVYVLV